MRAALRHLVHARRSLEDGDVGRPIEDPVRFDRQQGDCAVIPYLLDLRHAVLLHDPEIDP
jgi:hypothetical protein